MIGGRRWDFGWGRGRREESCRVRAVGALGGVVYFRLENITPFLSSYHIRMVFLHFMLAS
jgi:hypothetical protein